MSSIILTILIILFLNGIVSAVETAIYSITPHRAKFLAEKHRVGAMLFSLKESIELPMTTLIALSNFITITGSIFVGLMAASVFGAKWLSLFAAILTFLIMLFGEIIPKRLGERYAEQISLAFAPIVLILSRLFAPVIWITRVLTRPFLGKRPQIVSKEEISFLTRMAAKEGVIKSGENQIIQHVFKLNDITAADIMTPRAFVDFIDGNKTVGEMEDFIREAKHSRFPVFDKNENNVIGMVHQRNLLMALVNGELNKPVKNYAWDAVMISESRLADDVLHDLRDKRAHLAVVVSEYGEIVGVVGVEDVVEELIGEIIDEKDIAPELIKRVSRNEIIVHGQTRVSYINDFFNTFIKSKKTINGFLLDKLGELPQVGAEYKENNLSFFIEAVGPRTIDRVRILKIQSKQ